MLRGVGVAGLPAAPAAPPAVPGKPGALHIYGIDIYGLSQPRVDLEELSLDRSRDYSVSLFLRTD